jgi:hypothetical protein
MRFAVVKTFAVAARSEGASNVRKIDETGKVESKERAPHPRRYEPWALPGATSSLMVDGMHKCIGHQVLPNEGRSECSTLDEPMRSAVRCPRPKKKRRGLQPDTICGRAASGDVARPMLVDRCRAAEECLDSFIDTAAGSHAS